MFLSLVHFSFCLEPKAYFQYLYFVNLTRGGGGGGRIPDPSPLRSTHVISSFFKVCKLYTNKKCTLFEKNMFQCLHHCLSIFRYCSLSIEVLRVRMESAGPTPAPASCSQHRLHRKRKVGQHRLHNPSGPKRRYIAKPSIYLIPIFWNILLHLIFIQMINWLIT